MFMLVFVGMAVYMGIYLFYQKDDYISSSYNSRLKSQSDTVIRGQILSDDGQILAQTIINEDGSESRNYPYGNLFAQSVGYTVNGKTGIEAIGNFYMINSHESFLSKLNNGIHKNKYIGDNIITSLDVNLQQTVYDAIGDRKGACVVMETDTGRILSLVSKPDFDPNTLADNWDNLISDDENSSLVNRATRGLYPPGSTFKLLTALEYMRENPESYEEYEYECTGSNIISDDYTIHCVNNDVHGIVNLEYSLAYSCNCSFANIGLKLDNDSLAKLCEEFLYNGTIPGSYGCAKSRFTLNGNSDNNVTAQTAVGQGETLVSPLHNALIAATIANGGCMMKPYVIDKVVNKANETVEEFYPSMYGKLMSADEAKILTDMMTLVVNEGSGAALKNDKYQVAGKTGTSQFSSSLDETHAWFIGFAPADNPKIVVSIVLEKGGAGGTEAAQAARKIFDAYFSSAE